jgi:CO/xanthine dehydrogenase Mo-binding subunit
MNALVKMTRRQILGTTGFLSLAFVMPSKIFAQEAPESIGKADGPGLPHDMIKNPMLSSWLRINSDGTVTLLIGKVELGQGNRTAIAQVCAEELGVDFGRLQIIAGDTKLCPDEGVTSGSSSMPDGATAVKYASAEVREILFGLAATKLGQPAETMKVKDGSVTAANGKTTTYWDLVIGKALDVKATGNPKLKDPATYTIEGTSVPRLDIPPKIEGGEIFIQDMHPEGAVYGMVARPPNYRSKLISIDTGLIEKMPGVIKVVHNGSFLGVIAKTKDEAMAAAAALGTAGKWQVPHDMIGNAGIYEWLLKAPSKPQVIHEQKRSGNAAPAKTVEATYHRPYVMHGSIGTSAAIAQLGSDGVMTIHTHSQSVWQTADAIAKMLKVTPDKVRCIHTQGSGCYGHNMADDAAADAALLAAAVPGMIVKLQYTRAQEHQWEPYGSAMVIKIKAGVDGNGNVLDWETDIWSTSHATRPGGVAGNLLSARYLDPPFQQPTPKDIPGPNYGSARNAIPLYEFPGQTITTHFVSEMPIRVSSTRSLGAYANVFALETFIDELARDANVDPIEYRLRFLKDDRARAVLKKAADLFGWSKYQRKPNQGRGIAFARYKNHAALTAVAMEVRVIPRNGRVQVLRVSVADDSGQVVNPNGIANQMEGAVIQSLSWTLKEEVRFSDSAILSADWASYPILTFQEVPHIDVAVINQPGMPFLGTGEAGQGPTAAAVTNAIYDAVGVRLRTLPLTPDRVKAALNARKG